MNPFARHPGLRGLGRYLDKELPRRKTEEIQRHLTECERCRRDLAFMLEVRRVAPQISHPSPPRNTLMEILDRRAAGERIILPMSTPPKRSLTPGLAGPLALLLALVAAGVLVLTSGEASAGSSVLMIGPERPHLGQPLEVTFRAASRLTVEERVVLRGRYRTAAGGTWPERELGAPFAETLARTGDGTYGGTTWLPPSAVYAVFAVEDPAATRIETAAGRPWEVLAHDDEGRPLLAALEQRFRAMEALARPEEMRSTAVRMTELYPDEPEGWFLRLGVESQEAGEQGTDLIQTHRHQLVRLERAVSRLENPGAGRIATLAEYARRLGEAESAQYWTRRLLSEHPNHPRAQRQRVHSIVAGSRALSGDPGEHLRAFELEWARAGAVDPLFVELAFEAALRSGDLEVVRLWADRYARFVPALSPVIAAELAGVIEYRAEGMARLRHALADLEPSPSERPLLQTQAEYERDLARRRRELLSALGRALVAEGRLEAGMDTLALATAEGWAPDLFRELAATWAEAGRSAEALRLYGMAAADPLARPGLLREAEDVLGALDPEAWAAARENGRRELAHRIAAAPATWPPGDGEARVVDAEGRKVELGAQLRGRTSLLAFWVPGAEESEALARLAERLVSHGVRVFAIWVEAPGSGLGALSPELPAYLDADREASEEFGAWPRPWYVVLDRRGRMGYASSSVEEAFRHAFVLSADPPQ